VLEERTVMRIGSNKAKSVNVRFITATNRSLTAEVRAGRFRRDLYYRISGLLLDIPPLRQRKDEIEPLARHFLQAFCHRSNLAVPALSEEALQALREHLWPGNVRELRNVMERAALLAGDSCITRDSIHLESDGDDVDSDPTLVNDGMLQEAPLSSPGVPSHRQPSLPGPYPPAFSGPPDSEEHPPSTRVTPRIATTEADREIERVRILRALEACAGNQTRSAKVLNVSRRTLINRMEEFKLPRPKKG
jgi:DNA-binding NtrC family response regulator